MKINRWLSPFYFKMTKRRIKLRKLPDLYFFDQNEAERYFQDLLQAYEDLRIWLPQFEELKDSYLALKNRRNAFGEIDDYLGSAPIILLFPTCCGCMFGFYIFLYIPFMIFSAIFSALGIELPSTKRRLELVGFTNRLRELPVPTLTEEKILRVDETDERKVWFALNGGISVSGQDLYSKYLLADSPSVVFRLSERFDVVNSLGRQLNAAEILDYFRRVDAAARWILR